MIVGFQKANPDVAVRYEDMLTGEIYDRIVEETDAGEQTADFAFSSAMDLQVKLANDGYAQRSDLPMSAPLAALGQLAQHRLCADLRAGGLRLSQAELRRARSRPRRGPSSSTISSAKGERGLWPDRHLRHRALRRRLHVHVARPGAVRRHLVGGPAMGAAGVKLYSTSSAILERVADGRFVLGYNILGSYAADWAARAPGCRHRPAAGTIPSSCRASAWCRRRPPRRTSAGAIWNSSCRRKARRSWRANCRSPRVSPDVAGDNTANTMQEVLGAQLRPVPVSPGLMVYLDQVKRARLIARWNEVLRLPVDECRKNVAEMIGKVPLDVR